jgi:hypothetical protein
MSNPIGARKDGNFKSISTAPSFNKTPVGSSTPPLPYATIQDLGNSVGVVPNVRFNGKPVYVLGQSTQPSGKGDEPGVAKGVKSGTVTGEVKPVKGSSTVRVGKKAVVRHGDPCTMNGGNNPGIYCTTQMPSAVSPQLNASQRGNTSPETEDEKSVLDQAVQNARSAAKGYQKKVSGPLHSFADKAMDKGGTAAAGGVATAFVGGGMVSTGIGAAPGVVLVAGGGLAATVGGAVATVGGATETVATGADAVAAFVVDGKMPDVVNMATAYVERMVTAKVDKLVGMIPGLKAKTKEIVGDVKDAFKKPTKKKAAPKSASNKPGPAGDGTKVKGDGKDGGRCQLRPYSELKGKCPGGGTPHHVVPDHCFRPVAKKTPYLGGLSHGEGLSICVSGATKCSTPCGGTTKRTGKPLRTFLNEVAEHGEIHYAMDAAELALGLAGDPKYTASLEQLEKAGAANAARVTGCDPNDLEQQLRIYHQSKGLGRDTRWRADPFGTAKTLSPAGLGTSVQSGASGRK